MGKFENKVVIVTGASSGIGAATAIAFAKEGAKVAIHGRNEERLNKTATSCENEGAEVLKIIADLTVFENLEGIIKQTVEKFSAIDILINNAANPNPLKLVKDIELEDYKLKFQLNTRAPLFLCKYAYPHLEKTKGCIVNISSILGTKVQAATADYAMTKAALDQFTRCFSLECAASGIRVNSIQPGVVDTGLVDKIDEETRKAIIDWIEKSHSFGIIQPEAIVEGIFYLCSSAFVTGTSLMIDSGSIHV